MISTKDLFYQDETVYKRTNLKIIIQWKPLIGREKNVCDMQTSLQSIFFVMLITLLRNLYNGSLAGLASF